MLTVAEMYMAPQLGIFRVTFGQAGGDCPPATRRRMYLAQVIQTLQQL